LNIWHSNLSFGLAQDGERVEPFRISIFEFRIYTFGRSVAQKPPKKKKKRPRALIVFGLRGEPVAGKLQEVAKEDL